MVNITSVQVCGNTTLIYYFNQDVPDGKRILIIIINARHKIFSILNLVFTTLLKALCRALILIVSIAKFLIRKVESSSVNDRALL